jgi:sugar phosphate isomerase/epimerase
MAGAMNRRRFLLQSASLAFLAASPLARALEADNAYRRNIGLQLYTLRNELKNDTAGTIKAVAAAGYKQGEMFGFPNCDPVIAAARDAGLALHSTHFEWDSVVNPKDDSYSEFQRILEKARTIGLSHLVIPYLADQNRQTLDDYKKVAAHANRAAALAKKAGIQLAYHNHAFEFEPKAGGKTGFDIFTAEFSPDMQFELDVFWVKVGGVEPVDLLKKLSGRVSQVHLKDLKPGLTLPNFGSVPADAFQELGDGVIPMEPILAASKAAGVKHAHVEQDQSPDPLASVRQSIDFLRRM